MSKPDSCSSINCNSEGSDYCQECSHLTFFGEGKDKAGVVHYWTFSRRFGPLFTDSKHIDIEDQPDQDHPCWEAFEEWHDKRRKS